MLSVHAALEMVRQNLPVRKVELRKILDAIGGVLAEDILADTDVPPFRRAMMDGYAVDSSAVQSPPVRLKVLETVHAGTMPAARVEERSASRVMTGAPVPDGADSVVRQEDTRELDNGHTVEILVPSEPGKNIVQKGEEMKAGEVVLKAGNLIRPQEIGVLALVGKHRIRVFRRPTVAILATGSELVEISKKPLPAQVRNSNSYSLAAQVLQTGASFGYLGIAEDTEESVGERIRAGLGSDVLLITGGVSVGERDLVPQVLVKEGVQILFHKVKMKPGRPLLFGKKGDCLVFGMPGNPVSTFVSFEVFVRPVLAHLMGNQQVERKTVRATLTTDVIVPTDRMWFAPGRVTREVTDLRGKGAETLTVALVESRGSADIGALTRANCLIVFAPSPAPLRAGTEVDVMLLDE